MNTHFAYLIRKARDQNITQPEFQALALERHYRLTGHWDAQYRIPALEPLPCYALSEAISIGTNDADFIQKSPGGWHD